MKKKIEDEAVLTEEQAIAKEQKASQESNPSVQAMLKDERLAKMFEKFLAEQEEKERIEKTKKEAVKPESDPMVKGIFKNLEAPGMNATISFRAYKGPIQTYHLYDEKEYEIPLSFAKHLNNNCSYPVHSHLLDSQGRQTKSVGKVVNRFQFRSLDYR